MSKADKINHVALVVEDMDAALAFWRDALGVPLSHIEEVPSQESIVAFLPVGESEIELVKPTTDSSGIARYLAKRGPGIHHICLEVADLNSALERLKSLGVRLINETPTIGAGGARMAFIHPSSAFGVLVELYEKQTTAPGAFPRLETERLHLRPFEVDDAPQLFDIFSRDEVTQYLNTPTMQSLSQAVDRVFNRIALHPSGRGCRWAIALKERGDQVIGSVGYHIKQQYNPTTVELGFELHPEHWRQGYMTEAIGAILDYVFDAANPDRVHRVEALTYLDNDASINLLKKIGFQEEGILRQYGYWKDAHHDLRLFSILKPDWHKAA